MQPIPPRFPHINPARCSGRTTRMLIRALDAFYMKRRSVVVVAHNLSYASDLASMFIQILHSLQIQPAVTRNHNIAAVQIKLDHMEALFVSNHLIDRFWEGRKQEDYSVHRDHYTGN